MNRLHNRKIFVTRTPDIEWLHEKSLVVVVPGEAIPQPDLPSVEKIPVSYTGCVLHIESAGGDERSCAVKVIHDELFSPNVTEGTMIENGVFFEQPDIQNPHIWYLNQEQAKSITLNDSSLTHSREEDLMLVLS